MRGGVGLAGSVRQNARACGFARHCGPKRAWSSPSPSPQDHAPARRMSCIFPVHRCGSQAAGTSAADGREGVYNRCAFFFPTRPRCIQLPALRGAHKTRRDATILAIRPFSAFQSKETRLRRAGICFSRHSDSREGHERVCHRGQPRPLRALRTPARQQIGRCPAHSTTERAGGRRRRRRCSCEEAQEACYECDNR